LEQRVSWEQAGQQGAVQSRARSQRAEGLLATATVLVVLLLAGMIVIVLSEGPRITGPEDGAVLPAADTATEFVLSGVPAGAAGGAELDGTPVDPTAQPDGRQSVALPSLAEGEHRFEWTVPRAWPLPSATARRDFTVDTTPPQVALDGPLRAEALDRPLTVRGNAGDAVDLRIQDESVPLDDDGAFSVDLPAPPASVHLVATDRAGNTTDRTVPVPVAQAPMRAVHMSALAWSSPTLREPVLAMVREGRINAVQLDIKDESGEVGYASQVPLAQEIGAAKGYYDAAQALDELHALGVRVVGRLVAFRDPVLATHAWQTGRHDMVAQTTAGQPWAGGYGSYAFTNFADPDVRRYNIDLATEAAGLGFDDILYDYVRRPDGSLSAMHFPGLQVTPEASIASFLHDTRAAVRPRGALVGASVFGIAASRPEQIAQDIPAIAQAADYIAPMVYPSHWGAGEYGVAAPESQPYDITQRSVADFHAKLGDSGATVVPWLQAFSLRVTYGAEQVRQQIAASADAGSDSFVLWNAACRYDPAALPVVTGG
jgi:hypothetical protein